MNLSLNEVIALTIKPGKETKQLIALYVGVILFCWIIFSIYTQSFLLGTIFLVIVSFVMIPWVIASARTFVMDENGCTVKFLWLKKTYTWRDMKTKQYVTYDACLESNSPCNQAAEFSIKQVRIPKSMKAHTYCWLFHPFSFVFVYFPPRKDYYADRSFSARLDRSRCSIIYEADEEEFRSKMNVWGVEMEEVKRGMWV